MARRAKAASVLYALAGLTWAVEAMAEPPRVWIADDATRVRRDDVGLADVVASRSFAPDGSLRLAALREEVVAFQAIVETGGEAARSVSVGMSPATHEGAPSPLVVERFLEHYVEVRARSRNDRRPEESLGWSPAARPADAEMLGWVPDALVPIEWATGSARGDSNPGWAPHPFDVPARSTRAVWIDVFVPEAARPGEHRMTLAVDSASHGRLASIDVVVDVHPAVLPYRPVSVFAAYDPERSLPRTGDRDAAEKSVWQLLHAHHVDAVGEVLRPTDAERLRPAFDGSWFTPAHGYRGPGAGAPPEVIPLGLYGQLGDPGPASLATVDALVDAIGPTDAYLFVYAIDERCDSPRGPNWRALLAGSRHAGRVRAGHTCHHDPRTQDVDLVMMPSDTFEQDPAREARERGKDVWVYNGALPRSGPMHLDAHYVSLLANGWIAATRPVSRWFLWEATFWHDKNRGGKGPIDPFTVAESFHNADGDAGLFDGLLVYPGAQPPPWLSLGKPGTVVPSMRLKMLRRGIQDAGYLALTRSAAPRETGAIAARMIPAALDELPRTSRVRWPTDAASWSKARDELRALVPTSAPENGRAAADRRPAASRTRAPSFVGLALAGAFATLVPLLVALVARSPRGRAPR